MLQEHISCAIEPTTEGPLHPHRARRGAALYRYHATYVCQTSRTLAVALLAFCALSLSTTEAFGQPGDGLLRDAEAEEREFDEARGVPERAPESGDEQPDAPEDGGSADVGSAGDTLSDEEQRALEEALAADQDARDEEREGSGQRDQSGADQDRGGFAAAIQSLNPEISFILDVAAAYFSEEPMQLGAHDPNRTGFTFQQLEMALGANVDPFFRFDANLVFSEFGVEVEEAYGTTLAIPGRLQFRYGQYLTAFGRLNRTHPHSWSFVDQPLVNGKFFGGEGSRGLGAEVSWLAPTPWYLELIASMNMAIGECCARSFFGGDNPGVRGVDDFLYTLAIKQFFDLSPDWGLQFGLSGQFGPNPTGLGNRSEIYGADLYLRYRPVDSTRRQALSLQVEVMHRRRQVPDDLLEDWGGYAQVVWNVTEQWETGARYGFVTGVDDDYLDDEWDDLRHRVSVQGTFYPSHFSRFRMQLSYDDPTWEPRPILAAMLSAEILVGAHGAHEY